MTEVKNGCFIYRDTFFADVGGDRRHPRASPTELKDLLFPRSGHVPNRDQVAHWYEAQLLHYGLPRTKDKNTAKVRLLSAITSGTLSVPTHIAQLEASMKREFEAKTRKARTAAKNAQRTNSPAQSGSSKKRKAGSFGDREESATRTKISVKIGDVALDIDHHSSLVGIPKKQKTATTPKTKQTARKTTKARAPSDSSARKSVRAITTNTAIPTATRPVPAARAPIPQYTISSSPTASSSDSAPPPPYDSHDFSQPYSHSPTHLQASGHYTIITPSSTTNHSMTLVKDPSTNSFWAHFHTSIHAGIFHIPDPDGMVEGDRVPLKWRAEDLDSGHLLFRRDQDGWIQFDGEGGVRGCWNGLADGEDLEFEGVLDGGADWEVRELVERWDWFPRTAYGR